MPGHPRLPAGKIHRPPGRAVFRMWAAPARALKTRLDSLLPIPHSICAAVTPLLLRHGLRYFLKAL